MKNLIYFSQATHLMSGEELQALLDHARQHNSSHGVTGLLLYQAGYFLQMLEGNDDQVLPLFAKIEKDARHHSVKKIYDQEVEERNYDEWNMGFHVITDSALEDCEGYSNVLSKEVATDTIDLANEMTFTMVSMFKQYVRAAQQGPDPS